MTVVGLFMLLVRQKNIYIYILLFYYFANVASSKLLNIFTLSIAQYDNALEMRLILGVGGA
jgi:hypothetical protein